METTNNNDGHDPLQYQTLLSVPRLYVRLGGVDTVNTVPLYYTTTVVQRITAKYLHDLETRRCDNKDEAQKATGRKVTCFVRTSHYNFWAACLYPGPSQNLWRANQRPEYDQLIQWTQRLWLAFAKWRCDAFDRAAPRTEDQGIHQPLSSYVLQFSMTVMGN